MDPFGHPTHHHHHLSTDDTNDLFAAASSGNAMQQQHFQLQQQSLGDPMDSSNSPSTAVNSTTQSSSSSGFMKKKRTAQACDRCSKKKIRCDGEAPCENCSKASTECTFSRGPRRRGPRTGYMAVINQRLHQMEQLLIGSGAGAANANTGPLPMIPSNSSSLNSLPVSREDSTPLSLSAGSVIPNHDEDDAEPVITGLFAAQFSDQSRRHSGPATFQAPPQHRPIADFLYDQTTQSPTTKKGATSSSSASAHQSSSTSFSSFGSNPDSVMNYRSDATLGLGTIDSLSTFSGSSSSLLQQLPMTYQENEKESASLGASNGTEHGGASSSTHVPFTGLSMGEDMLDQTLRFSSIRPPTDSSDQPSASGQPPHNPPSSSLTGNVGNTNSSSAGPSALSGSNSFLPIIHAPPVRRPSRQEITPAEYSHLWRDEPDWKLLDIFFSHVYPSVALIPRLAFYQIAYEEPGLLLNAMYALAAGFQQSENGEVDRNAGLAYLTEAKNQLVAEIETPSFGIVYALYLLSYYATHYGQLNFASAATGLAIKQGLRIGLSNEETFDYDVHGYPGFTRAQNVEIVRRLWWLLYRADVMDRRSGDKFFLIRDEDCETCLPCDDASVWDSAVVQDTWVQPRSSESKKQLLHLGSKTSFYTAYPVANHLGLIAQLQKLHRRVIEFNFRITDLNSCFTTHESDFEAQQLETALDYFSRQLHPNVKAILSSHYLSRDLESNQIYWSMVYAQALLRYLYFFLYNSRYAGMDRYGIDTYANRHGPVVETLRVYAIKFTEVMDKFMAHNNFFMYTSPFMLTMVFDVGVLHLYAAKLCDWPEVAEENRGCLQKHIYALSGSSKFLSESERQALILVKGHQIDLSQISDDSKPGKLNADLQILFRQHT